ncbi:ionotropic receptor 75a [Aphomia sociella]
MNLGNLLNFLSIANATFVLDYFLYKHVNNVVIFHCNNARDIVSIQKIYYRNCVQTTTHEIRINGTYEIQYLKSKVGILFDGSCVGWAQVLSLVSNNSFKPPYSWIIITQDLESTTSALSRVPIDIDSDVVIAHVNGNIYNLYEVYNTGYYSNGTFNMKKVGFWNNILNIEKPARFNMTGVILKCPVVITERVVHETYIDFLMKPKKYQFDSLHRLKFFTLLTYLREMYNYSYEIKRVNSWGYVRNGSFDGIVGALQQGEGDFGGSSLFFRSDRASIIDYILETWPTRQCFIFRHPKHPGAFYAIYTRPLTAEVWYCIFGMLLTSTVILGTMFKLMAQRKGDDAESSLSLAFLFSWSAICQQGMGIQNRSMLASMKIAVLVVFVYALTLYQYYNAIIVSTLLHEPPKTIRTIEDLLKSNFKAGAEDTVYTKDYFKRTTDSLKLELYNKKIATSHHYNFFTPSYGMALVKQGGFALHVDSVVAYKIIRETFTERENCELQEIELYPPQKMGMVVRKQSPYKEHLTYGVRKMFESGLLKRLVSVWDEPKPPCVRTPDASIFSVSLREVSIAFIILVTGMMLAVTALMSEILIHRIKAKDGSCVDWAQVFSLVSNKSFKPTFIWAIITRDLDTTVNTLASVPIDIDSDVIIAHVNGNIFNLHEVYNTGYYSNGIINIRKVGIWNNTLHTEKLARFNMTGVILKCPVVVTEKLKNETFEDYLMKSKKPHIDSLHKLKFFTLLTYLREMYNYSYELKRVLSWGYISNGSFDGIVGALQQHEADLSGSSLFFRADRATLVDYIVETWPSRQCFIFRHPKHLGAFYTVYTRPLTFAVWYCILGMLITSAVILGIMFKLVARRTAESSERAESSLSLAFLFSWSAICQQGMGIPNRSMLASMKIAVFVTFVFALTLYQYYNAIMVSKLLHESPKNIRTLEDLLKSDIKAGIEDVLYTKDYFKGTTDPIALEIYKKKIVTRHHYNFFTPTYGMALVKQGGFALHVDSVVAYRILRDTFTEMENCELQEIEMYPPHKMGIIVRKLSPYKEHITYGIRKMFESGLLKRLLSIWDEPKPPCVKTPDASIYSVSLRDVSTAFLILLTGVMLAATILLCEILIHRMKGRRIAFRN